MSQMPSFKIRPCWDPRVIFLNYIPYVKFNKVSSGGLNVRDHLLLGIRYEKYITHTEMLRKYWLKLELGN